MSSISRRLRILVVLATVALVTGCGTLPQKKAIYIDSAYNPESVSGITLLSPIDARVDQTVEVELSKQLNELMKKILEERGYTANVLSDAPTGATLLKYDLKAADAKLIKTLGPDDARWVMILVLDDVTTQLTFGSTGNAEVSGFMFDKQNGTTVWRDKGIGRVGQGGLYGMVIKSVMDEKAIRMGVFNLSASVPLRRDK